MAGMVCWVFFPGRGSDNAVPAFSVSRVGRRRAAGGRSPAADSSSADGLRAAGRYSGRGTEGEAQRETPLPEAGLVLAKRAGSRGVFCLVLIVVPTSHVPEHVPASADFVVDLLQQLTTVDGLLALGDE